MATKSRYDDLDLGATIRGLAAGQIVFGRYRLDRILGRGGMGVVWLAHDQELNEATALKFLPDAVRLDAIGLEDLKRETRKSRKLTHQNIVRVYNFVSDDNSAGISMEWIDGATLSTLRQGQPNMVFEPAELKTWVKQACGALEYAHFVAKLIHRDLKPANIMINGAGEVKVADFGISSSLTESASRVSLRRSASGTLAYMSPQQALGERPMVADDVYSLGATIYELIAGKPPFFRGDLYAQVRDVVPPSIAERRAETGIPPGEIPEQWEKTVAACLEKEAAKRPQSAMEAAWRLGLVSEYEPRSAPEIDKPKIVRISKVEPPGRLTGRGTKLNPGSSRPGALGVLALAAASWYFLRPNPAPVSANATPAPTPTAPAIAQTDKSSPVPERQMTTPSAVPTAPSPAPPPVAAPVLETQAVPVVDAKVVGSWQNGTSASTRKRLKVQTDGRYLLLVAGTITDSGTLSAVNGRIREISKSSPQPFDLTYEFVDGELITQGDGPLGKLEWHRSTSSTSTSSNASHPASNNSSQSAASPAEDGGIKQQMLNNFRARYGF